MNMSLKNTSIYLFASSLLLIGSCDNDEPVKEDVPELITRVEMKFSEAAGGSSLTVDAVDPDGEGVKDMEITSPIILKPNTEYLLKISLYNTLVEPGEDGYDLTKEVEEEGDEHMFFFSWTKDPFTAPKGNGNIDARADAVIYSGASNAVDSNGLPLGLTTDWTTGAVNSGIEFRVKLMHQPGLKSATSGANEGETDLDLTFTMNIQ